MTVSMNAPIAIRNFGFNITLLDPREHDARHLNPVVDAVADIDQSVMGDLDAMHGIAELLRHRGCGIVSSLLVVVRLIAIGAPSAACRRLRWRRTR
jgi:hypothetical protein